MDYLSVFIAEIINPKSEGIKGGVRCRGVIFKDLKRKRDIDIILIKKVSCVQLN